MPDRSKWSLIGIPDHAGVLNVRGRIGAALAPDAFRRTFERLRGRLQIRDHVLDFGNIKGISITDVESNHKLAAQEITRAHQATGLSVVIGGGHDHGYSHLIGLRETLKSKSRLGCINLDAHLDVRKPVPEITSGSPFYLALENGVLDPKRFTEFGIQSHCNGDELWEFIERHGAKVVMMNELRGGKAARAFKREIARLSKSCDEIAISLDLDSIAEAYAPGVSAPQAEGFTPSEILEMMEIAGASPKVTSLGIFELNPVHDRGEATSRLAAMSAWHFIESALQRKSRRR